MSTGWSISRSGYHLPKAQRVTVKIGGVTCAGLRPVRGAPDSNAINKAGRLVLSGMAGAERVKIYEAASAEHAGFLAVATGIPHLAPHFPATLGVSGQAIVTQWAEGAPLSKWLRRSDSLDSVAALQAQFHAVSPDILPPSGFDYWADFILPRFRRACGLLGDDDMAERIATVIGAWCAANAETLNHPDMHPDNILIGASGTLIVIDNELLWRGAGWFMDVMNTLRALGAKDRPEYLAHYLQQSNRQMPDKTVCAAFWLAREAGAAFAAGDIGRLLGTWESTLVAGAKWRESERGSILDLFR